MFDMNTFYIFYTFFIYYTFYINLFSCYNTRKDISLSSFHPLGYLNGTQSHSSRSIRAFNELPLIMWPLAFYPSPDVEPLRPLVHSRSSGFAMLRPWPAIALGVRCLGPQLGARGWP